MSVPHWFGRAEAEHAIPPKAGGKRAEGPLGGPANSGQRGRGEVKAERPAAGGCERWAMGKISALCSGAPRPCSVAPGPCSGAPPAVFHSRRAHRPWNAGGGRRNTDLLQWNTAGSAGTWAGGNGTRAGSPGTQRRNFAHRPSLASPRRRSLRLHLSPSPLARVGWTQQSLRPPPPCLRRGCVLSFSPPGPAAIMARSIPCSIVCTSCPSLVFRPCQNLLGGPRAVAVVVRRLFG